MFKEKGKRVRWCQPDGLLIDVLAGVITILEMKYQHTAQAYWQLHGLYLPVVKRVFGPSWTYKLCEVTKWYDPAIPFPTPISMQPDVKKCKAGIVNVHIWRP